MNQTDDRTLERVDGSGSVLTPAVPVENPDYARNWALQRLSGVKSAGLVEREEGDYYRITERGQDYLTGGPDADGLRIDDE